MNDWETVIDAFHDAGWSYGYMKALDTETGRCQWIADVHRTDEPGHVSRAEDLSKAFRQLQEVIDADGNAGGTTRDMRQGDEDSGGNEV